MPRIPALEVLPRPRARRVVRFGWLPLAIFVLIAFGATQAGARPPQCVSDRDCRHLRDASCGDAGVCVQRTKPDPKADPKADPKPAKIGKFSCENTHCEQGSFCIEESGKAKCVDPCEASPCLHGGSCEGQDAQTATCTCALGWIGEDCGQNVDDCAPDPCLNGGACADGINSYTCSCPEGWTGTRCQTLVP